MEMKSLEMKQPAMFQHLLKGVFVVRRSAKSTFKCIPTHQAPEQTINREAKSDGGVIGFTLRKLTLLRWLLTRYVTGEYAQAYKEISRSESETRHHKDLGPARLAKDKEDVSKIKEYVVNYCENPFDLGSSY
jgi:hypothetical protein